MQFGNLAFGDGDQRDAEEAGLFVEGNDMFLVKADPIEAFGDDEVDPTAPGVVLQLLVTGGAEPMRPRWPHPYRLRQWSSPSARPSVGRCGSG